eukprot:g3606.t1
MPAALREIMNDFSEIYSGFVPNMAGRNMLNEVAAGKSSFCVVHTKVGVVRCRYSYVYEIHDNELYNDHNKYILVSVRCPWTHQRQPWNDVTLYCQQMPEDGSRNGNGCCSSLFAKGGIVECEPVWESWDRVNGTMSYKVPLQRGLHPYLSKGQIEDQKLVRVSLITELRSQRVLKTLMKKSSATKHALNMHHPVALTAEEKKKLVEFQEDAETLKEFKDWLDFYGYTRKKGESEFVYAARWYQAMQCHYYYFADMYANPSTVKMLIRGDTAMCGSSNYLYVMGLRVAGIKSRPIGGDWLTQDDGSEMVDPSAIESETMTLDVPHCQSEFYIDGLGWIPTDATPTRLSRDFPDYEGRRKRQKELKQKAWDPKHRDNCFGLFGNGTPTLCLGGLGCQSITHISDGKSTTAIDGAKVSIMYRKRDVCNLGPFVEIRTRDGRARQDAKFLVPANPSKNHLEKS